MPMLKHREINLTEDEIKLFWSRVDVVDDSDSCWNWNASIAAGGYGYFNFSGTQLRAHRVSFKLTHDEELLEGFDIDHSCHNRKCVRPSHLRQISHKHNQENRTSLQSNNTSGYPGVYFRSDTRKWAAEIKHHGKRIRLGCFDDVIDAARAVKLKRLELFTYNSADEEIFKNV